VLFPDSIPQTTLWFQNFLPSKGLQRCSLYIYNHWKKVWFQILWSKNSYAH